MRERGSEEMGSRKEHLHLHPLMAAPTRSDPEPSSAAPNNDDADEQEQYLRSRLPPAAAASLPSDAVATTTSAAAPEEPAAVRYKECMRNHAAASGRHVVDGCGEFMPAGHDAMRCAACDCHRSFHRQETEGGNPPHHHHHLRRPHPPPPPPLMLPHPPRFGRSTSTTTRSQSHPPLPPGTHNHHQGHPPPAGMLSFGGGGEESSSEDVDVSQPSDLHLQQYSATTSSSGKRFRTRFTQEQKDRMAEFAERIGWRIQKQDEAEVHQLCSQIGVKRKVFKVWMHNNKQPLMKQRRQS